MQYDSDKQTCTKFLKPHIDKFWHARISALENVANSAGLCINATLRALAPGRLALLMPCRFRLHEFHNMVHIQVENIDGVQLQIFVFHPLAVIKQVLGEAIVTKPAAKIQFFEYVIASSAGLVMSCKKTRKDSNKRR